MSWDGSSALYPSRPPSRTCYVPMTARLGKRAGGPLLDHGPQSPELTHRRDQLTG